MQFLLKGQRSKSCHAFLPEGVQIEGPNPGLLPYLQVSQLDPLAELLSKRSKESRNH